MGTDNTVAIQLVGNTATGPWTYYPGDDDHDRFERDRFVQNIMVIQLLMT